MIQSTHTDARQSNFIHVGRDHININIIADSSPERTLHHFLNNLDHSSQLSNSSPGSLPRVDIFPSHLDNSRQLSNFNPGSLPRRDALSPVSYFPASCSTGDIAATLIIKIVQLLISNGALSGEIQRFREELETLHKTLTLTGLATQTYQHTPVGRIVANVVIPEVDRCCVVLQILFHKINSFRQVLHPTSIRHLWHQVWWGGWADDEFASMRAKLLDVQKSLAGCLMALHSVSRMQVRNELRDSSASLEQFHDLLHGRLPFLGHIPLNTVFVVDHLGKNIPVPTMFCSTWKDFNYIIKGYCQNRVGDHHVNRGDYEVIRPYDGQIIRRSEFASAVQPGMTLEMSIILHQEKAFRDNRQKCPRCHHINRHAADAGGWIECCQCEGQFQVVQAERSHDRSDKAHDRGGTRRNGEGGEVRGTDGGQRGTRSDGEGMEDHDSVIDVVSPASQTRGMTTSNTSGGKMQRPEDVDGTQFFRRIHVFYTNSPKFPYPSVIAHKPHRDLTGQVTKGSFIGPGGLADVYKGEWTNPSTGQSSVVAVRILRVVYDSLEGWSMMSQRLNREAWIWDQLSHPNVLPFLGISNDAGGKRAAPGLISPLCTQRGVVSYLRKNPDADRLKLAVGVAKGLRYLHSMQIIHGDLKLSNVLISDDCEPLLYDFGRSRIIIGDPYPHERVLGVLAYQAPELIATTEAATDAESDEEVPINESPIDREIYSDKLTTKTDVYAYAMVALQIFTGKAPYYYIVNNLLKAKRIKGGEQPQRRRYHSRSLPDARWALLAECWVMDPASRPEVDLILPRLV